MAMWASPAGGVTPAFSRASLSKGYAWSRSRRGFMRKFCLRFRGPAAAIDKATSWQRLCQAAACRQWRLQRLPAVERFDEVVPQLLLCAGIQGPIVEVGQVEHVLRSLPDGHDLRGVQLDPLLHQDLADIPQQAAPLPRDAP